MTDKEASPSLPLPSEPLTWRFTGIAGLKPFLTDKQYEAQTPGTQKWYEPVCKKCAGQQEQAVLSDLSDEQIICIRQRTKGNGSNWSDTIAFARAILAASADLDRGLLEQVS